MTHKKTGTIEPSFFAKKIYGLDAEIVDKKLQVWKVDKEALIVSRIFDMFLYQRLTLNRIAEELNNENPNSSLRKKSFYPSTIKSILSRPEYCGYYRDPNGSPKKIEKCEAIVSYADWNRAQYLLGKKNKGNRGSVNQCSFPLTGFLSCYYCGNKYYIKQRLNYYYHRNGHADSCKNQVKLQPLTELVYTLVVMFFTRKDYLLGNHDIIFYRNKDNLTSIRCDNFKKENIHIGNAHREFTQNFSHYIENKRSAIDNIREYEDFIKNIENSSTQLPNIDNDSNFISFIKESLNNWYLGKNSARLDSIQSCFQSLMIRDDNLVCEMVTGRSFMIKLNPLGEYWKNQIKRYGSQSVLFQFNKEEFNTHLDELINYLSIMLRTTRHQEKSLLVSFTNMNIKSEIKSCLTESPYNWKYYYPISDYQNVLNSKDRITDKCIFTYKHKGQAYITTDYEPNSAKPYLCNEEVVAFEMKDNLYINSAFIHRLPEWFYGYNYEYFKLGYTKICFVEENGGISAFKLEKQGKRLSMELNTAIDLIVDSKEVKYIYNE